MSKRRYAKNGESSSIFIKDLHLKNSAQEYYASLLRELTVTLCTGPAGTGKTYIAAYLALEALLDGQVDKIILTRPIVACEDIGYLPGDMMEKVHPYLMPLLDAIEAHVGPTKTKELFNNNMLEILPLAYMRGRTLNRAFVILDEAQNATKDQIKMFLTRLGFESKMVVNGDASQSDLPKGVQNGLTWAIEKLRGCDPQVGLAEFSARNIVRHPLISTIISNLEGPSAPLEAQEDRRRSRRTEETPVLFQ